MQMQNKAKERFKKLIKKYAFYIKEAAKLEHVIQDKAIPFLEQNNFIDDDVENLIKNYLKLKELLKELLDNDLIAEIIKLFNADIEQIHLKE